MEFKLNITFSSIFIIWGLKYKLKPKTAGPKQEAITKGSKY